MSKTVSCDICGRTREDLLYKGARVIHFKKHGWGWGQEPGLLREFDICDLCLQEIKDRMRKKEDE